MEKYKQLIMKNHQGVCSDEEGNIFVVSYEAGFTPDSGNRLARVFFYYSEINNLMPLPTTSVVGFWAHPLWSSTFKLLLTFYFATRLNEMIKLTEVTTHRHE